MNNLKKNSLRPIVLGTASALALSLAFFQNANAAPIEPIAGTATIDGNASEWNTSADLAAAMCTAGSVNHETMTCEGSGKENLSNLYLRYDCNNDILYVLVLEEAGYEAERSADDAWVTIGGNSKKVVKGSSGNDGTPPDFAWVEDNKGELIGYEASFDLAAGTHADVEVHLNVSGNTSSTGKKNKGGKISIAVPADCEMPPVGPAALLATYVDLTATLNGTGVDLSLSSYPDDNTAALLILRGNKANNGGTRLEVVCDDIQFNSNDDLYYECSDNVVGETYRVAEIEFGGGLILYDEVTPQ